MSKETVLLNEVIEAINAVYRVFGPPGDYGYNTANGAALNNLYNVNNRIVAALPGLRDVGQAQPAVPSEDMREALAELRDEVRITLADLVSCCTDDGDLDTADAGDRAELDRLAEMVSRADRVLDSFPAAPDAGAA